MSLWNRGFNTPIERWMNHVVRRELDHLRRPQVKGAGRQVGRPRGLTEFPLLGSSLSPAVSNWVDPYWGAADLWEDPFFDSFSNYPAMNALSTWTPGQVASTTNDKGDLVLKTKLPFGLTQDDVHLDFEDGGLRLTASKSHEEEKKLHGTRKGSSRHSSSVSIEHYWPLGSNVKAEDIEAHWNEEEGLLEISVVQPKIEKMIAKAKPILIGGASRTNQMQSEQMLEEGGKEDEASPVKDILDAGMDAAKKAKDTTMEYASSAKETAKDTMNKAKETAKDTYTKGKETIMGESKDAKQKQNAKQFQDYNKRGPSVEDNPPSLDEM